MIALLFLTYFAGWKTTTVIHSEATEINKIAVGVATLYTLDVREGTVTEWSHAGEQRRTFAQIGPGPGELQRPFGGMIEAQPGEIWVSHQSGRAIAIFRDAAFTRNITAPIAVGGFVPVADVVVLVPNSSDQPFVVVDLTGKELSSFRLPNPDLPLPTGVKNRSLWQQIVATEHDGAVALSWHWLPVLGRVDLNGGKPAFWQHDLYPTAKTAPTRRGPAPLAFTGRTLATSPNGHLLVGTCDGSATQCAEVLVVDINSRKLLDRFSYEPGIRQMVYRHGLFAVHTMSNEIHLIEPSSMDPIAQP